LIPPGTVITLRALTSSETSYEKSIDPDQARFDRQRTPRSPRRLHALIVRSEKVTPALIDALPSLKVILRAGAGYNTIDTKYARQKKIDVMNTPGANANAVAEEVIALMLADARHLIPADASTRRGEWEKTKFMGRELTGKTVGIVGPVSNAKSWPLIRFYRKRRRPVLALNWLGSRISSPRAISSPCTFRKTNTLRA
jgi:phosphoglycerate dehydrogenase-like enzyme